MGDNPSPLFHQRQYESDFALNFPSTIFRIRRTIAQAQFLSYPAKKVLYPNCNCTKNRNYWVQPFVVLFSPVFSSVTA